MSLDLKVIGAEMGRTTRTSVLSTTDTETLELV
jgi:hypothetical protein